MRKSNIIHAVGIGRKAMSYWKFGLSFADGLFRKIILLINYSNPFLYFLELEISVSCVKELAAKTIDHLHCFNSDCSKFLAFTFHGDVLAYNILSNDIVLEAEFDGTSNSVVNAKFHPTISDTAVLLCQDKTFKVWNTSMSSCLYNSHVICGTSLSLISLAPSNNSLVCSTTDGIFHSLSYPVKIATTKAELPEHLYRIDFMNLLAKFLENNQVSTLVPERIDVAVPKEASASCKSCNCYFSHHYPPTITAKLEDTAILALFHYTSTNQVPDEFQGLNVKGQGHYAK